MSKKKGVLFLREEYGEGFGKYTYLDGEKYEGDWKNGKYHGQGKTTHPNGSKFVGEWKNGRWNQGTYTDSNGKKHVGEWKEGKMWNTITYDNNGTIFYKFVNGKMIIPYPP